MNTLVFSAISSVGFAAAALWFGRGAIAALVILSLGGFLILFANAHDLGVIGVLGLSVLVGIAAAIPFSVGTLAGLLIGSIFRTQPNIRYGIVATVFVCLGAFTAVTLLK